MFHQSLALSRSIHGDKHPNSAYSMLGLGEVLLSMKRPGEAEAIIREAVAIRQESLPADHPLTAEAGSLLGASLVAQSRFAEAEPVLIASYETLSERYGNSHRATTATAQRLVDLYESWGRPDEARRYHAILTEPR